MALPLPPTCFGANAKDANPKATVAKCGRPVGGDSITEHFPPISTWSRVASPVSCSASTRSGQFGYYFGPKPLICNRWILSRFTAKQLAGLKKYETLNQRVQGSSPCAPTILASRNNSTWKPAPGGPICAVVSTSSRPMPWGRGPGRLTGGRFADALLQKPRQTIRARRCRADACCRRDYGQGTRGQWKITRRDERSFANGWRCPRISDRPTSRLRPSPKRQRSKTSSSTAAAIRTRG